MTADLETDIYKTDKKKTSHRVSGDRGYSDGERRPGQKGIVAGASSRNRKTLRAN